ncbi:hypothetical protein BRN31_04600 [Xanthomonas oryzae pv. oryzae]|nr:hypothetical protein BRN31_04600 [Xanthomonas oryzae pv. oryzae]RBL63527.1 hypothetical protein BRN24_05675 [Xanthomonas oryzae pv. oryzae]
MSKRLLQLSLAPAALAAGAGVWIFWKFDPNLPGNPFPPCIFHALTGFYCAGCGMTRALHALAHGDLERVMNFERAWLHFQASES